MAENPQYSYENNMIKNTFQNTPFDRFHTHSDGICSSITVDAG